MSRHYSVAEISATEIGRPLLKGYWNRGALISTVMSDPSQDPGAVAFYEDLAARLKLAVEDLPHSKGEIAESIGVSQQRLSNWITNQNKPDWYGVARLCQRYRISPHWVLLGDVADLPFAKAERWGRVLAEKLAARQDADRRAHEIPHSDQSLVPASESRPPNRRTNVLKTRRGKQVSK